MNKRVIGIIVAVIVVVGGFLYFTKPKTSTSKSSNASLSNHVEGGGSKKVTLTEYGDFQCPACGAYYPVVKTLFDTYKDQIYFQFRNFPLESLHQNARAGARAAEAANLQGKYWEMHDILYENQQSWSTVSDPLSYFKAYAQKVNVTDLTKFDTDYKSAAVNDTINADLQKGQSLGITGTPTFFLDGTKIENPRDQASFSKLIDNEIAKKNPTPTATPQ
jgi:protein-disulfide isomerase